MSQRVFSGVKMSQRFSSAVAVIVAVKSTMKLQKLSNWGETSADVGRYTVLQSHRISVSFSVV